MTVSREFGYVGVLFVLFVLPRALQRFGIPAAITSLGLGAAAGMGLGLFQNDPTIALLSAFGIVALFLFAGLDVDVDDLRRDGPILLQHLAVRGAMLAGVALLAAGCFHLEARVATLVALALLTPSTGFILESLKFLGMDPKEHLWIKSKSIATELLALGVLFGTLQSTTLAHLGISIAALAAMIALLPMVFRAFAAAVVPHAPGSEFAFLLMVALVCAFVTRNLGVYYLVGAFVVGMAAQRFRERLPAIASDEMIRAVELFATFFIPFYFFHAGLILRREDFGPESLIYGAAFLVAIVPLRLAAVVAHRRIALHERMGESLRIAVPLLPTLIFGLVIAEILRDRFGASPELFGGLILYTLATTLIPALVVRRRTPEYIEPRAPRPDTPSGAGR